MSYEVVGEHSAPQDFMDAVYRMLLARGRLIHIVAKRINVDELSTRRGELDTQIEFDFVVTQIDFLASKSSIGGYQIVDGERGPWITIHADEVNNHVQFDLFE